MTKTTLISLLTVSVLLFSNCSKSDGSPTTDDVATETDLASFVEPSTVTSCTGSGVTQLVCLAETFKASLNATQLTKAQRVYSVAEAQKWSNFPAFFYTQRIGLTFGEMTNEQIGLAKALILAAMNENGDEGYSEVNQITMADDYLGLTGGNTGFTSDNYYIALLGTPSTTGLWQLYFGGHHLAITNTYENGTLAGATPSFRAVEPFETFTVNNVSGRPLIEENIALVAMLNGLNSTELATAKLNQSFSDCVVGPQNDGAFPATQVGLSVASLTSAQKTLVMNAIKTYVNDINSTFSTDIITQYESELDQTYISYAGTSSLTTQGDYVRIDGPHVWIEYSAQGNHPHSLWRDKTKDYGGN